MLKLILVYFVMDYSKEISYLNKTDRKKT